MRRLYVMREFRRSGVGSALMRKVIRKTREHFDVLTLRTDHPAADLFYRSLGFQRIAHAGDADATHLFKLEES